MRSEKVYMNKREVNKMTGLCKNVYVRKEERSGRSCQIRNKKSHYWFGVVIGKIIVSYFQIFKK